MLRKKILAWFTMRGTGPARLRRPLSHNLFSKTETCWCTRFDARKRNSEGIWLSLVFFNACEVGVSGLNLGVIGGFAEALIEGKFGGFVAPLWSVYDMDATTVVLEFLQNVLLVATAQRQPFAAALQKIRNEYGEQSPTFLSYTYYGDVMATFV